MQKSFRAIGVAALIGLGVWGWLFFFPGPEKVIRSRLNNLAKTISFESKDGLISRGYNAQKAGEFFTRDVEVSLDMRGDHLITISGRDEIVERAMLAARMLKTLKVEFLDINVTLDPDKQTAVANLTGNANTSGEREFNVQEFNFKFRKVDGKWLIYKVETVKTLSIRIFSRAA
jgi:hypothetical protein